MADNKCETCDYKRDPQGGHCYMFREEPTFRCMQHQDRRGTEVRVGTIGHVSHGKTSLTAAIATILARQADAERRATTGEKEADQQ